ncbi:acetate/propionate family kinase [Halopseudomonas salina]|uniref:Acetate kinase n=1 Tax=Halopseudomonas salina TaxID=1323744 RepID=A0ABQ1PWI2_9GAMM|nr:acetate kinase [Halopseudomonas salina]GGD05655.1 acetate kinase [Halopseudomonas salina]
MTQRLVLVINCGSSSIKFALRREGDSAALLSGLAERLGSDQATLQWKTASALEETLLEDGEHGSAMAALLPLIEQHAGQPLSAVGHRVVHGGEHFTQAQLIDNKVIAAISANADLAPLHNPANLTGIQAAMAVFPDIPHVAIFDTAFHQSMPAYAYRYAIPEALYREHAIRRYGFHGTSHQYVTHRASLLSGHAPGRGAWLSAHLGNGCSSCAVLDGRSLDTSMGLTPLEGLVMGTRSGDVDPNLHAHLGRTLGWDLPRIEQLLNRESGLLGLSGLTNDMRQLEAAADDDHEGAKLAIEVFCYRLARSLLGLCAALPRLDGLLFTGGIGENSAKIRARTVEHMGAMGLKLDEAANNGHARGEAVAIHAKGSPTIWVIPTDEERQIADESLALLDH